MKIHKVSIRNFRGYNEEISFELENLTAIVGKNDIGKSTILEALDIFFNDGAGTVKIDKEDINKEALAQGDTETVFSVVLKNLPPSIIIDDAVTTTFQREYLLNSDGHLEIIKKYSNAGKAKVFIKASHPTKTECADLLLKKQKDLRDIINDNNIPCDNNTINSVMRASIWSFFQSNLELQEIEIDTSKEDAKQIFEKLQNYLPQYSLFQSDRKNSDGDNEVQDPLKESVKQILSDPQLALELDSIANKVREKLLEVSSLTLGKLQEIAPEIAQTLNANVPETQTLKWVDVFKNVSISGDDDISINKRGSGVKRLVLLSFFRAEAERRLSNSDKSVIYAIEEPETSQHFSHQRLLIKAFKDLSDNGQQILITTHSSTVVKSLSFDQIRLVNTSDNGKIVLPVIATILPYPSLNEVNYTAFGEISEEYHNELYGHIEENSWLSSFRNGKPTQVYIRLKKDGSTINENKILTEYIRHQIHHPENVHNPRFTDGELSQSISLMRDFINNQP